MAADARPDLVVLDLGLPDVPGTEVAREVRAVADIPIVMLTARSDEEDRIAGLELGADDYVTKPFSPRELALRVRAVLRRRRSRSRGVGGVSAGSFCNSSRPVRVTVLCQPGTRVGIGREWRLASIASCRYSDADRPWRRQVSIVERIRSIQRLPRSDWVPPEIRRRMTGPRIARSASLFVGVMPGTSQNVHSASYSSSSPAQKRAVLGWRPRAPCSSSCRNRSRNGCELLAQREQRRVLGMVGAGERRGVLAVDREHLAGDVEQSRCRACRARPDVRRSRSAGAQRAPSTAAVAERRASGSRRSDQR